MENNSVSPPHPESEHYIITVLYLMELVLWKFSELQAFKVLSGG